MKPRSVRDFTDLELVDAYIEYGSVWKVGAAFGIHGQSVHRRLTLIGAVKPMRVFTEAEDQTIRDYYEQTSPADFDLAGLASLLNRTKACVCRQAGRMGLTNQARPNSDKHNQNMSKPRWQSKPHPRGALGMVHSDGTKAALSQKSKDVWKFWKETGTGNMADEYLQKVSDRMSRKIRAPESTYSRGSAGRRDDLGDTYFRSSWEANYARYLNWLIGRGEIDSWEYEPVTFWFEAIKRGVRSYKPDFRIHEKGKSYFVEVKGWMDPKSVTKLKRMAKYYPAERLVLVDKKQYASIKTAVSALIPHWEHSRAKVSFPLNASCSSSLSRED